LGRFEEFFTSFEGQWLTSNQHNVCTLISTIHLILAPPALIFPRGPRRVVQTRSLVSPTAHISSADHAVPVCDREIEQASSIHILVLHHIWRNVGNEVVDLLDCLQHSLTQNRWSKSSGWRIAWIMAHAFQCIEIQSKRPLAVCAPVYPEVPLVCQTLS